METGFVLSQDAQQIQDILNYVEQQLPGTLEALSKAIGDETTRATDKENELARTLIPKSEKGAANGVASLNGGGQVPNDQLQWSMRGALNPSDIDSTSLAAGIYQVNGKVLSPAILGGEGANGVMVQYPWGSRVQLLLVGRAGGASAGEQVEIYVRRYLTGPQRWTGWLTTADFAKKSEIVTYPEVSASDIYNGNRNKTGVVSGFNIKTALDGLFLNLENRIDDELNAIENLIPSTASPQNQLADKDFVNHSVATNTANFIGTFASVAELEAYSGPKTNNDYAFVIETDAAGNEYYDRYKWSGTAWLFEYRIESTAFTAAQWAAIQSGITSALVTKLQGLENYDDTSIRNAIALIEQNYATKTELNALSQTVDGKQAKVAIEAPTDPTDPTQPITTLSCEVGKYYRIDVAVDTLAVTLPAVTGNIAETVVLYLTAGTTPAVTIASASAGVEVLYHSGYEIAAGKNYEINCLWNGAAWIVSVIEVVIPIVEVEYLRSSGTQWIDTGIVPTDQTNIAIKFLTTYLSGANVLGILGCRATAGDRGFCLIQLQEDNMQKFRWDYSSSLYNIVSVTSGWHITTNDGASITFDGTRYVRATQFAPTTNKISLFCVNQNGIPIMRHTALDIASFSVTENGALILDLIPVRVGQVGYMYDKVSGQLFRNAGTGDFIVGPDKN